MGVLSKRLGLCSLATSWRQLVVASFLLVNTYEFREVGCATNFLIGVMSCTMKHDFDDIFLFISLPNVPSSKIFSGEADELRKDHPVVVVASRWEGETSQQSSTVKSCSRCRPTLPCSGKDSIWYILKKKHGYCFRSTIQRRG